MKSRIYGYYFAVVTEETELGYVAYAPGIGGVYEEGKTEEEAKRNAYESACAIIEVRLQQNNPIVEDNEYLKVLTAPPDMGYLQKLKVPTNGYISTGSCMGVGAKERCYA
jgi:predicted RNase H-like HicB family nuclease